MGDKKLTLFELHFEGEANFGGEETPETKSDEAPERASREPSAGEGPSIGSVVKAVAVVAVLALVVRAAVRFVGGEADLPDLAEVETGSSE